MEDTTQHACAWVIKRRLNPDALKEYVARLDIQRVQVIAITEPQDGQFSLIEVECLGACVNAPILQVNDDFYEDLDRASTVALLEALKRGEKPPMGSVTGRQTSAPAGGAQTLTTLNFDAAPAAEGSE